MKQSSTTTRGRKKATGNTSSSERGASASQHRTNGKSATAGSRNHTGGRNNTGSGNNTSSRNAGSRGNVESPNSTGGRSNRAQNSRSGEEGAMRGQTSANTQRQASRRTTSHQGHFQGDSHLEKFFLDQLQDIYYAENKILQSLPKMAEATTTGELREAFEDHLHQTQRHVKRLEKAFESIGKRAEGKKCEAIEGIAREVDQIIEETEEGTLTRDAALIIAAQKVEHYEIATYGGLVQLAITMDLHAAADLLDKTLVEEEDTDSRLTEIAENEINLRAEHEGNEYSWNTADEESQEEEEGDEDEENENPSML